MTFGGHQSETKIAEEETGSIPHCSAAATGVPQTSRVWSGPQQSYSKGARLLEGKLKNRNNSSSTSWASTERPNQKVTNLLRRQVNKSTKIKKKKKQNKKDKNT